eukprot:TRINITY_DN7173_c0_g1_i5.p1 TRINITY_DN7173_c0_g1~~TRINITY_DN7173_c0_g1_i5.p1  ORF type:complete len:663 (-),score=70.93 TRINITY_DN7173_c0_g1_i5:48-2036(-)
MGSWSARVPCVFVVTVKLLLLQPFTSCVNASADDQKSHRFRVWAPNAKWVSVHSVGHRWNAANLTRDANATGLDAENWEGEVVGVEPGDCYVFRFNGGPDRFDPRAVDISPDGSCSIVPFPYEWNTSRVVVPRPQAVEYQIDILGFTPAGTFDAAIEHLDHLVELGINIIHLLPITFSEPYDESSPLAPNAVSPQLGGSLGLKRFVDSAAQRGIAVSLDVVWNHAPESSLLYDYDGPDDIYFAKGRLRESPWGVRFDFEREGVAQFILDSIANFIDEFHILGFHWDSTLCIRFESSRCDKPSIAGFKLLQRINQMVHTGRFLGTLNFAKDFQQWLGVTRPVNDDVPWVPEPRGGLGFDAQWQDLADNRVQLSKFKTSMINVDLFSYECTDGSVGERLIYSEVLDVQGGWPLSGRIPTLVSQQIDPSVEEEHRRFLVQKKTMLITSMTLLCTGTPLLFWGQEFMSNYNGVPWSRAKENEAIVREVRDLTKLRTTVLDFAKVDGGRRLAVYESEKIAVLQRCSASRGVVLIVNAGDSHWESFGVSSMPFDGVWRVLFDGDSSAYSPLFNNHCASQKTVNSTRGYARICIPPLGVLVLATDVIKPGSCIGSPVRNRQNPPQNLAVSAASIVLSLSVALFGGMFLYYRARFKRDSRMDVHEPLLVE